MSYEGHVQHICANGHRYDTDCRETDTLCDCGAASVFRNDVDDTNCESWGIIPEYEWEKLLLTPEVRETCGHCNHTKVVAEATYRVPTTSEVNNIRCWAEAHHATKYVSGFGEVVDDSVPTRWEYHRLNK